MRTLPQLLWSDLTAHTDGAGAALPCSVPAIGLPYRVAAFLLAEGLRHHAIAPLELLPVSVSTIPAHAAYFTPETVVASPPSDFVIVWHHALSFITAIDGSY